jgi:transposase InsO family protein
VAHSLPTAAAMHGWPSSFRMYYGREFCGRPDRHPNEIFLQLEEIEHRTTKVRRPQCNGFIERFHRTLLDEHPRVKGRTTWHESLDEMQTDLDQYLDARNTHRPHRGLKMNGRTLLHRLQGRHPEGPEGCLRQP